MLKSFNSLLIDKVQCVSSENILPEFFPAHCTCMNFFWHDGLVQEFFSYAYALAGYFFSKSPTPPPPPQKSNGRPLNSNINSAKCTITLFANSLIQDLWM